MTPIRSMPGSSCLTPSASAAEVSAQSAMSMTSTTGAPISWATSAVLPGKLLDAVAPGAAGPPWPSTIPAVPSTTAQSGPTLKVCTARPRRFSAPTRPSATVVLPAPDPTPATTKRGIEVLSGMCGISLREPDGCRRMGRM
jgi:hypothetical protein